jgi:hypothetical protein
MDKDINVQSSEDFRQSLAKFIIQQTQTIQEQDVALGMIIQEFLSKVKLHEIEPEELRRWYGIIQQSKSDYARSLLDIFRPSGQNSTPLLAPKERDEEAGEAVQLDTKQLNAVNKFMQIMETYSDRFEHREDDIETPPAE